MSIVGHVGDERVSRRYPHKPGDWASGYECTTPGTVVKYDKNDQTTLVVIERLQETGHWKEVAKYTEAEYQEVQHQEARLDAHPLNEVEVV